MVDLSVLQTASYLIAALSFAVTCAYYIMNLNNNKKNQQVTLETRQAQLFRDFYSQLSDKNWPLHEELRNKWSWSNYDDFIQKYGEDTNPDNWFKMVPIFGTYEEMGIMFRKGLFDPDMMFDQAWGYVIPLWEKFEPIIFEYRIRNDADSFLEYFEDLYYYMKERGLDEKVRYGERFSKRVNRRKSLGLNLTRG
jgi:hypothetical protein